MKRTVTRFTKSDRWFHNIVMITFTSLLGAGLGMFYLNLTGQRDAAYRALVTVHEIVAIMFIAGPVIALLLGSRKVWKENFGILARWGLKDIEWLVKKPLKVVFKSIRMPRDDKFNPGQKAWATVAVSGSAVLAVTGIILWTTNSPILALFIHAATAILMLAALLGHAFMALVNPDTRPGLGSIVNGEVDAQWALHHHPLWMERMARERVLAQARRNVEKKAVIAALKKIEGGRPVAGERPVTTREHREAIKAIVEKIYQTSPVENAVYY